MAMKGDSYRGPLYSALNPVYARIPLSGRGAEIHGGRFNPKGAPTLYSALDLVAALREASQIGSLQPINQVSYLANVASVFDAREAKPLAAFGTTNEIMADPCWHLAMLERRRVPTQDLVGKLIAKAYAALLVRSFAEGVTEANLNLVICGGRGEGRSLNAVDHEGRLDRM